MYEIYNTFMNIQKICYICIMIMIKRKERAIKEEKKCNKYPNTKCIFYTYTYMCTIKLLKYKL